MANKAPVEVFERIAHFLLDDDPTISPSSPSRTLEFQPDRLTEGHRTAVASIPHVSKKANGGALRPFWHRVLVRTPEKIRQALAAARAQHGVGLATRHLIVASEEQSADGDLIALASMMPKVTYFSFNGGDFQDGAPLRPISTTIMPHLARCFPAITTLVLTGSSVVTGLDDIALLGSQCATLAFLHVTNILDEGESPSANPRLTARGMFPKLVTFSIGSSKCGHPPDIELDNLRALFQAPEAFAALRRLNLLASTPSGDHYAWIEGHADQLTALETFSSSGILSKVKQWKKLAEIDLHSGARSPIVFRTRRTVRLTVYRHQGGMGISQERAKVEQELSRLSLHHPHKGLRTVEVSLPQSHRACLLVYSPWIHRFRKQDVALRLVFVR